MDLLGKIFINNGDDIIIEEPGYLGAIQAFSIYRPTFNSIPVDDEGIDIDKLTSVLSSRSPKLFYSVPNFQNPSGISYSESNRQKVAEVLKDTKCTLIQDDPYGDLRFSGQQKSNFLSLLPDNTVLLGSFSKTVAPALRLGWLVASPKLMDKLIIAKQAADLHTNYLAQRILYQYLTDNNLDDHIKEIIEAYGSQKEAMMESINKYFPQEVQCTNPEGGMFLWATLPEKLSAMELFDEALKQKVAFVPGTPFYVNKSDTNTLRLNFSCMDIPTIKDGIKRLGQAIHLKLNKK